MAEDYVPPEVWTWDPDAPTAFRGNRPVSGATHERPLPRGEHPFQLYSLGTPNGQKVTILFEELIAGRISFWGDVHRLFLVRDLTRNDIRGLVQRGLATTHGSYRAMVALFHIGPNNYKRFLNFLAAHDCRVDVQSFRADAADRAPAPGGRSAGDRSGALLGA